MKLNQYILGIGVILAAILYRFLPHVPNFSPVNAVFLFAGATLVSRYKSFFSILLIVFLSDFALNNTILRAWYPDVTGIVWFSNYMIFTFISFALIFTIGTLLKKSKSTFSIISGSIAASVIFFLLTNAGSWIFDPMNLYANGISGLFASIIAGLPFFGKTLASDMMFSGILFGLFYLASNFLVKTEVARV